MQDSAALCACGWSSPSGARRGRYVRERDDSDREDRRRGLRHIGFGATLIVLGVVITKLTGHDGSIRGGVQIIAYGPILGGIIEIIRGVVRMTNR